MPQSISTGPPCAAALPPRLKEVSHGRGGGGGAHSPPGKAPGPRPGRAFGSCWHPKQIIPNSCRRAWLRRSCAFY